MLPFSINQNGTKFKLSYVLTVATAVGGGEGEKNPVFGSCLKGGKHREWDVE